MYNRSKKILASGLALSLFLTAAGTEKLTFASYQQYDMDNIGIAARVDSYLEKGGDYSLLTNVLVEKVLIDRPAADDTVLFAEAEPDTETLEAEQLTVSPEEEDIEPEYPQLDGKAIAAVETKLNIRTEADPEAEIVGTLSRGAVCDIIENGEVWTLVSSGSCEGYVRTEYLRFGDDAARWNIENGNPEKAIVNADALKVREEPDVESECLTLVALGESYVVIDAGAEWTEIEVDDALSGYVKNDYIEVGFKMETAVSVEEQAEIDARIRAEQEERERAAREKEDAENSQSNAEASNEGSGSSNSGNVAESAGTETSVQQTTEAATAAPTTESAKEEPTTEAATESYAAPAGSAGQDVVDYAMQYLGNPYVYGGTSLTNGTDCSGFTQSVYKAFGYSLPRTAAQQAGSGVEVNLSDIQPGDLLFYSYGGSIGHVAIYAGGGQIVHASSSTTGIITSSYNYRTPCKAVRIVNQ